MGFVDRLCRRSATFLTQFAIFAGWQSPLQKYISLPLHTSVFGISKRHAHKVFIKCPVSKLRLRLQTVETGHYFCSLMPLRKARNLVKAGGQRYILETQIRKGNFFIKRKKDSGRTAVFFEKVFLLGYSKKLCNVLGGYKCIVAKPLSIVYCVFSQN